MTSPFVYVRNDPRTPLEKALNVNPELCRDRTETPMEAARRLAIEYLLRQGIRVLELPGGRWSVNPEYPTDATEEEKAKIDYRCEQWMRKLVSRENR